MNSKILDYETLSPYQAHVPLVMVKIDEKAKQECFYGYLQYHSHGLKTSKK